MKPPFFPRLCTRVHRWVSAWNSAQAIVRRIARVQPALAGSLAELPKRRCAGGIGMHRFLNGWKHENNDEKITFRSGCP